MTDPRPTPQPSTPSPEGAEPPDPEEAYRRAYPTGWRGGHRHFIAGWLAREAALPDMRTPEERTGDV